MDKHVIDQETVSVYFLQQAVSVEIHQFLGTVLRREDELFVDLHRQLGILKELAFDGTNENLLIAQKTDVATDGNKQNSRTNFRIARARCRMRQYVGMGKKCSLRG